jgi:hypothetical protein
VTTSSITASAAGTPPDDQALRERQTVRRCRRPCFAPRNRRRAALRQIISLSAGSTIARASSGSMSCSRSVELLMSANSAVTVECLCIRCRCPDLGRRSSFHLRRRKRRRALSAESKARRILEATLGAGQRQRVRALPAELHPFGIYTATVWSISSSRGNHAAAPAKISNSASKGAAESVSYGSRSQWASRIDESCR